jgi:hypothetical protein
MHLAVVAGAVFLVLAAGWMLVGGWRRGQAA